MHEKGDGQRRVGKSSPKGLSRRSEKKVTIGNPGDKKRGQVRGHP